MGEQPKRYFYGPRAVGPYNNIITTISAFDKTESKETNSYPFTRTGEEALFRITVGKWFCVFY